MTWNTFKNKFIGDRDFYRHVLGIAIPIMLQNGITNFVGLLDNIMVGRIGTEQMAGVSIVNQLIFVFNLCIFGGLSGIGIFTAQYFGKGDDEGIRVSVRFKLWTGLVIIIAAALAFTMGGDTLIRLYLTGSSDGGSMSETLRYGHLYLSIMLIYLAPFMIQQVYSSTLRECGETLVPMTAGLIAVFVNLFLNYTLIYGMFGAPCLGVQGAAVATVISRFVEMFIVVGYAHLHTARFRFLRGLYRSLCVPPEQTKRFIITGMPLLVNETLWAAAMAALNQCYSTRGLNAVAGLNISATLTNVFAVAFLTMGHATAIIVGHALGADDMKKARDIDNKMIAFSMAVGLLIGALEFVIGPLFPAIYNTTPEAKQLAAQIIMAAAVFVPQNAFINVCYFTLRCGGKTIITFFFDSVFVCCISFPAAWLLSRFTLWPVLYIYVAVQLLDLLKCAIGYVLVKSGRWMNNIV